MGFAAGINSLERETVLRSAICCWRWRCICVEKRLVVPGVGVRVGYEANIGRIVGIRSVWAVQETHPSRQPIMSWVLMVLDEELVG